MLSEGQTLVDLPYPETATGRAAREAGATVVGGLDVLVAQGAASFELWTGVPAPVEVMRAAVGLCAVSLCSSPPASRTARRSSRSSAGCRPGSCSTGRRSTPTCAAASRATGAARASRSRPTAVEVLRGPAPRPDARDAARARRPEPRPQELDVGDEPVAARGRAAREKGKKAVTLPRPGHADLAGRAQVRPRRHPRRARARERPAHGGGRRGRRGREGARCARSGSRSRAPCVGDDLEARGRRGARRARHRRRRRRGARDAGCRPASARTRRETTASTRGSPPR